ncbi:MAG: dockerin type I domain-containing protein [Clostridiales bacterium]|nr:dockerin type I domain-containing protein [Clostridiales bacterium]
MRKNTKLLISAALALCLVLPVNAIAFAVPDGLAPAAARAEGSEMAIKRVEVLYGGLEQSKYRNQEYSAYSSTVYPGDPAKDNGEEAGKYYTTMRSASLTDPRVFTVEFAVDNAAYTGIGAGEGEFNPAGITWRYGGRNLSAWTRLQGSGSPITASNLTVATNGDKYIVTADIRFDNFYNAVADSFRNRPYAPYYSSGTSNPAAAILNYVGNWSLEAFYGTEPLASRELRLALYDSFKTWEEIDAYVKEVMAAVGPNGGTYGSKGRFIKFESITKTVEGRDLWMAVVSDSAASVSAYENTTHPMMLENPKQLQDMIKAGGAEADSIKIPISFSSVHGNEVAGPDICMTMIGRLLNEDVVKYARIADGSSERVLPTGTSYSARGWTQEKPGAESVDLTLNVKDLLDKFIVTFTFTINPDGRANMYRTNAYTYDMNLDASYMNQPEARAASKNIARWDPVALLDYHGWYDTFMIDAYTPPYEPSYEFDLLDKHYLGITDSIGRSMIGKAPYSKFTIPKRDVVFQWDAGSNIYTPTFAMLYGTLGSTIEFPTPTQDSVDAGMSGTFGYLKFCLDNRDELYIDKLENKIRGIGNLDVKEANDALVNLDKAIDDIRDQLAFNLPEREIVGRPKEGGKSFFPEYYVIPVTPDMQKGPGVALEFLRNLPELYVKYGVSEKPVSVGGMTYPAGTYVIDMHQANRSVVQSMLYKGYDSSIYPYMYSKIVCAYPDMRGFDCYPVYEEGAFAGAVAIEGSYKKPAASIPGDGAYVLVKNKDADAIRLVNRVLKDGKEAYIASGFTGIAGAVPGDFIVKRPDFEDAAVERPNKILGPVSLYVAGVDAGSELPENVVQIVKPKIGVNGSTYGLNTIHMLDLLEFDDYVNCSTTGIYQNANVYLDYYYNNTNIANHIKTAGIPVISTGGYEQFLNGILGAGNRVSPEFFSTRGEALVRGTYAGNSFLTANFENQHAMYAASGYYFKNLPEFLKPIATVSTDDDFFQAGWWYSESGAEQAKLKGAVFAAAGVFTVPETGVEIPMAYFADDVAYRSQNQVAYQIIANALLAFASGLEPFPDPFETLLASVHVDAESDTNENVEYTLSIRGAENALTVAVEFEIDGSLLAGMGAIGLNGFATIDGIAWKSMGGSVWRGAVTLGYPAGDGSVGFTSENPEDIAKFIFAPRAFGKAAMKLTSIDATGLDTETEQVVRLNAKIETAEAVTIIDQLVFSKYDLNKDNKVDALDLGIMLLYCGFDNDSPNWGTLVKVNDSRGKGVTASMCDVNGDGVIDMLDLLDLFIHYTK